MPEVTDSITGKVVPGAMETVEVPRFDDKLRTAYATAMAAMHSSGSVQIHVGTEVAEYLRSLVRAELNGVVQEWAIPAQRTMWGFPVVIDENARPESITVHVVQVIA